MNGFSILLTGLETRPQPLHASLIEPHVVQQDTVRQQLLLHIYIVIA